MRAAALLLVAGCGRINFDAADDGGTDAGDSGAPGARIAQIQRLARAMTTPVQVVDIAAVDPGKTIVLCDVRSDSSAPGSLPICELLGPTSVRITVAMLPNVVVGLQVIEMSGPVSVQRGTQTFTTEFQRIVALPTAVRRDRSFAVIDQTTGYMNNDDDPSYLVAGRLSADAELTLARQSAGSMSVQVAWQVVEIDGIAVQWGQEVLTSGMTTSTLSLQAFDPMMTWPVSSTTAQSSDEADYLVRTELEPPALIRAEAAASSPTVAFFVVSVPGARVHHGITALGSDLVVDVPFPPVDLARTFEVHSVSGGVGGFNNHLDASLATAELLDNQTLRLERAPMANDANCLVSWFVVEWPN